MLSDRFLHAFNVASELHATQTRKGSDTPYIAHLLAVASLVLEYGGSEEEAIAALLHDAVEDQGGAATLDMIRHEFGNRVASIVSECSDTDEVPKPPWQQRKEAYLAHIPDLSPQVQLVSLADKVHNARCILSDYRQQGEDLWQRFRGGREGTLWYYRSLVEAYRSLPDHPLSGELERLVCELEKLAGESGADV
jgi:(p)ppGpp synthase/HD superfamily hydrolase